MTEVLDDHPIARTQLTNPVYEYFCERGKQWIFVNLPKSASS